MATRRQFIKAVGASAAAMLAARKTGGETP
jgi:hypothetical protein